VPGHLETNVQYLSSGYSHTIVLTDNEFGIFGSNTHGEGDLPGVFTYEQEKIEMFSGGYNFTCVIYDAGKLLCFGRNDKAQLDFLW